MVYFLRVRKGDRTPVAKSNPESVAMPEKDYLFQERAIGSNPESVRLVRK